jgi:hypothetical protein
MKRFAFPIALALAGAMAAQTMSNLPMIVVQPFEEIKTNPGGESYAAALTSMMRTAIGSGLVFQTEGESASRATTSPRCGPWSPRPSR